MDSPALQVQAAEDIIKQYPQTAIATNHYFAGGIYEREIFVPKGTIITGKVHLTEHLAKLTSGMMTIFGDKETGDYVAPKTFISKPGAKRAGYAHTDCFFSTFHAVGDETDIEALEKALVVDTVEQYQLMQDKKTCLEQQ